MAKATEQCKSFPLPSAKGVLILEPCMRTEEPPRLKGLLFRVSLATLNSCHAAHVSAGRGTVPRLTSPLRVERGQGNWKTTCRHEQPSQHSAASQLHQARTQHTFSHILPAQGITFQLHNLHSLSFNILANELQALLFQTLLEHWVYLVNHKKSQCWPHHLWAQLQHVPKELESHLKSVAMPLLQVVCVSIELPCRIEQTSGQEPRLQPKPASRPLCLSAQLDSHSGSF